MFFNQSEESINDPLQLRFILNQRSIQSKIRSLPFIDSSRPISCLERSDSESSLITSSALSIVMISIYVITLLEIHYMFIISVIRRHKVN